jgi:hypothetical protein
MIDEPDPEPDPETEFGLGALESPPDARDWSIGTLFALAGVDPASPLPLRHHVPPPRPRTLNQGLKPECVAYSSAWVKAYEDLRDQGPFDFDEHAFFDLIGGTPDGAFIRRALDRMLRVGYPVVGGARPTANHRIGSYYAVPVNAGAIKAAVLAFGPVIIGTPWFKSWYRPVHGVLPEPTVVVGGHALVVVGWDETGFRLHNSWGTGWGLEGECILRFSLLDKVREAWKVVDAVNDGAATPGKLRLRISPRAVVRSAIVTAEVPMRIKGWEERVWGDNTSSASCQRPRILKGTHSGQATVAFVNTGVFAGRFVRVGNGTKVVPG